MNGRKKDEVEMTRKWDDYLITHLPLRIVLLRPRPIGASKSPPTADMLFERREFCLVGSIEPLGESIIEAFWLVDVGPGETDCLVVGALETALGDAFIAVE